MRTIEEINRLYTMLTSADEEMRDLAVSIIKPELFQSGYYHPSSRNDHIYAIILGLAADAYQLGGEYGEEIMKKRQSNYDKRSRKIQISDCGGDSTED